MVAGIYKATHTIILKAKTFIPLLDLFFKRLVLFNKKRTKNTDGIKTIKNACEAIAKKLRKRKERNRRTIPTPVKKKNKWTNSILTKEKGNNTKTFKKTRSNRRENVRIKSKYKIKNYLKKKWKEKWDKY